jgi:PTH2 family peptidyl-tRNA hydrolase
MPDVYGLVAGFTLGVLTTIAWKSVSLRRAKAISKQLVQRSLGDCKMVLVVRTELGMGKGKIAAQCSHAALGCYKLAQKAVPDLVAEWECRGQPKIVLKLDTVGEEGLYCLMNEAKKRGIVSTVIRDSGKTQIERGTATVTGLGPCTSDLLDEITGHLKLL